MDFNTAVELTYSFLKQNNGATNDVLLELLDGNEMLYKKVRNHLIFNDQAKDKNSVGLVYLETENSNSDEGNTIVSNQEGTDQSSPADQFKSLKIFISYGRGDALKLAEKIERDLVGRGHEVWLDKSRMKTGNSWEEQIEDAILTHDVFISLLSPHAVRRPDGVCLDEISMARFHNRKIVPVMVIHCRPPLSIYRLDWVDFKEWQEDNNYTKSVERVIKALHSQESVEGTYAQIFSNLKPLDFGVDIARMTKDFIGREWLFGEVDQWLAEPSSKVFFITGNPGIGKSAIMAHLASRHSQVMAYHFCISNLADTLNPDVFVRSLAAQLATQLDDYHSIIKELNFEQLSRLDPGTLFRRIIADPLKSVELKEKVVIIIDALDEAWSETDNNNIVRVLQERLEDLPDMVKIVVSSREINDIFDLFSKYEPYEIDPERIENVHDISAYLDKKFSEANIQKKLPESRSVTKNIKNGIVEKSKGNFLYVKQFIYGIESDQIDLNDVSSFPKGLIGIYVSFFDRIFSGKEEFNDFRIILEVITCLKAPFSAHELAPIVNLSEFEVCRKMQILSAFFSERNGKYYPYHKSITDWLTGVVGSGRKYLLDMESGRHRVCEFLIEKYRQNEYDQYLLDFLPTHLTESAKFEELIEVLLDFDFIIKKCKHNLVYELIKDYHTTFAVLPELRSEIEEEKEYTDKLLKFAAQLISSPESIQREKNVINSVSPLDDKKIEKEFHRVLSIPGKPDILKLILQFLEFQASLLFRYGKIDGFLLQQAINYNRTGPFSKHIESYTQKCDHHKLLYPEELRKPFNPFEPCLKVIQAHTERISGLSMTHDGKHAVSVSNDAELKLWDMQSGECLKSITPHIGYESRIDATPDLNMIASGGGNQDPAIRLWNYNDLKTQGELIGHTDKINSLKITPDGQFIISCGNDHSVKVWDTKKMECVANFIEHTNDVVTVDISVDGKLGISGGLDDKIYVWDIKNKRRIQTIDNKIIGAYYIKLSLNKSTIYSTCGLEDYSIKAWDIHTGKCIKSLEGNSLPINCIDITPDEKYLVSAGDGETYYTKQTIKIWDLETDLCLKTFKGHPGTINSLVVSPDLRYCLSGGGGLWDGTIRKWNIFKSNIIDEKTNFSKNIKEIQLFPDNNIIVNVSRKYIEIRRYPSGILVNKLEGHKGNISRLLIIPNNHLLVSASSDNSIRLWDVQSSQCLNVLESHSDGVLDISLSKDSKSLISCGWDKKIVEWDLHTNKPIHTFCGHKSSVIFSRYINEEKSIISISNNGEIIKWDRESRNTVKSLYCDGRIASLSRIDSKSNLYIGMFDGSVKYLDTNEMVFSKVFSGHSEAVLSIELEESEQTCFSGSDDFTIRQWDITTGICLKVFEGHTDNVSIICKIPGTDTIISTSHDETIRVWNIITGECIAVITTNLLVTSMTLIDGKSKIAYGTVKGEFKILELSTFQ